MRTLVHRRGLCLCRNALIALCRLSTLIGSLGDLDGAIEQYGRVE